MKATQRVSLTRLTVFEDCDFSNFLAGEEDSEESRVSDREDEF